MLKSHLLLLFNKVKVFFQNEFIQIILLITSFLVILYVHRVFLLTTIPLPQDGPKLDSAKKEHFFIYRKALEAQCAKEGYILNPKFLKTVDSTAEAIAR